MKYLRDAPDDHAQIAVDQAGALDARSPGLAPLATCVVCRSEPFM
jgi:hypothetical protein